MNEARPMTDPHPELEGWTPLSVGYPRPRFYARTRRAGEDGENVCAWVPTQAFAPYGGMAYQLTFTDDGEPLYHPRVEVEWFERRGGRTTVTHTTFAAPTHWRALDAPPTHASEDDEDPAVPCSLLLYALGGFAAFSLFVLGVLLYTGAVR